MKNFFANPIAPWIFVGLMFFAFAGYVVYKEWPGNNPPPAPAPLIPKVVGVDETYGLGEQVELTLVPFEVKPDGLQEYSVIWRIFDLTADGKVTEFTKYRKMPDGSILFGAGVQPKEMLVITSVNYLFKKGNGAETKCFLLKNFVKIGAAGPNPPNPPGPTPVFPDGQFKLSKFSYDNAMKLVKAPRSRGAIALSGSMRGVTAAIAAGTVTSLEDGLKKATDSNRSALANAGVSVTEWDAFFTVLQDELYSLYLTENKLTTTEHLKVALQEIADGLSKVE